MIIRCPGLRKSAIALTLALMLVPRARADAPAASYASTARPVRLVVVIVVDQMRADYLTRVEPYFGTDGFHRLMRDGAFFTNAYYSYGVTATAPGHATIMTGRLPRQHGIVTNDWYLDPAQRDSQASTDDDSCTCVGGPKRARKGSPSPHWLIGPALGDELKLADTRSRVFSLAIKSRAAVCMGGQHPDAAFWWDEDEGCFESSTWYCRALPEWLAEFNRKRSADRFAGTTWDRLFGPEAYAGCLPAKLDPGVNVLGLGAAFPHRLPSTADGHARPYYRALTLTPFGDELTLELATDIIAQERLGTNESPDLLCVSLSAFDIGGHFFGPASPEMRDFILRTDQQVAQFLKILDQRVGLNRCLVALTADHGVTLAPLMAHDRGLGGGQIDLRKLWQSLNAALGKEIGPSPSGNDYVSGIVPPWVYFNETALGPDPKQRHRVIDATARLLRRTLGVQDVYTADDLSGPVQPDDAQRWLASRTFHPARSGGLYVQLAPYWYKKSADPVGHTVGFNHDRHVPIILHGPGVRPGRYFTPADPLDIAPTLAALLGIEPPIDASGRVLHEALDSSAR